VLLLSTSSFALAASEPNAVRAEIDTLLTRLEQSGCDFYRNGEWHTATEAKAHLLRKLKATREPASTEQFIDRLASKSSLSGKPYLVRCAGKEPVESRIWLTEQLRHLREVDEAVAAPAGVD
jgi:hypothetical protein